MYHCVQLCAGHKLVSYPDPLAVCMGLGTRLRLWSTAVKHHFCSFCTKLTLSISAHVAVSREHGGTAEVCLHQLHTRRHMVFSWLRCQWDWWAGHSCKGLSQLCMSGARGVLTNNWSSEKQTTVVNWNYLHAMFSFPPTFIAWTNIKDWTIDVWLFMISKHSGSSCSIRGNTSQNTEKQQFRRFDNLRLSSSVNNWHCRHACMRACSVNHSIVHIWIVVF